MASTSSLTCMVAVWTKLQDSVFPHEKTRRSTKSEKPNFNSNQHSLSQSICKSGGSLSFILLVAPRKVGKGTELGCGESTTVNPEKSSLKFEFEYRICSDERSVWWYTFFSLSLKSTPVLSSSTSPRFRILVGAKTMVCLCFPWQVLLSYLAFRWNLLVLRFLRGERSGLGFWWRSIEERIRVPKS